MKKTNDLILSVVFTSDLIKSSYLSLNKRQVTLPEPANQTAVFLLLLSAIWQSVRLSVDTDIKELRLQQKTSTPIEVDTIWQMIRLPLIITINIRSIKDTNCRT